MIAFFGLSITNAPNATPEVLKPAAAWDMALFVVPAAMLMKDCDPWAFSDYVACFASFSDNPPQK